MIQDCKKGDIFEFGNYGDYQLILVFDHLGMSMVRPWRDFQRKHPSLANIEEPYRQLSTPTEFIDGKWIQFVESDEGNHGMEDAQLEKTLDEVFLWAQKQGISRIITTGVRDIAYDHTGQTARIEFIRNICSKQEYDSLKITLISRDKSYTKDLKRNIYHRHFFSEPAPPVESEVKVSEESNESLYDEKRENNKIDLLKEYYIVATPQLSQMAYIVCQMKETLIALNDGKIPNDTDYTLEDLTQYCQTLVAGYNIQGTSNLRNCWEVAKDSSSVPRNLRGDYIYFPTIIAVATMCRLILDFPHIAFKTDGLLNALNGGLLSFSKNPVLSCLHEHYVEAIELVVKSGVMQVAQKYPVVRSEPIGITMKKLIAKLTMDLKCGYIARTSTIEYEKQCALALESLLSASQE